MNPKTFIEPRRFSAEKKKFIDEEAHEMLAEKIIEPDASEYSSAIVVA